MWNRVSPRFAGFVRFAAILISLWTANAWAAMYATPNPSTNGSYTVYWDYPTQDVWYDTGLGFPAFYSYTFVQRSPSFLTLSASGNLTSMSFSGKSAGQYIYDVIYAEGDAFNGITNQYILQTVTVDVVPPVTAHFSINNVSATEGSPLTFTVTKNNTAGINVSVSYATVPWNADSSDFVATSGTLTFAPNEYTKTVTVNTVDDSSYERIAGIDENMILRLSNPTGGATISVFDGTGTIVENDPAPQLWVSDASVTEGGTLNFTVTKSGTHQYSLTAFCTLANGTATVGSDVPTMSSCLASFTPSDTQRVVSVSTNQDIRYELNETVLINFTTSGGTMVDGQGVGTIVNDDPAPVFKLVPQTTTVTEGSPLSFLIQMTGQSDVAHNITYTTTNGSAAAPGDYTTTTSTITGGALIQVPTINDSLFENQETLTFSISNPTGGAVLGSPTSATAYINSDDAAPSFSVTSTSGGEGTTLQFAITQNGQSQYNHAINYQTSNGTAGAPSDYTSASGSLSNFVAGTPQYVNVATLKDVLHEGNETFALTLSSPTNGATLGTSSATGTIDDDQDDPVTGAAAIAIAQNTTPYTPGVTAGAAGVDVTGNSTYELPIIVPPGTAGMEPKISLSYNSGNGNGLVGVGWTISGLSAITRCPATNAQDGFIDNVEYDAGDRFCLDGQRLMVVSGTYGANGAEYRTELNQFAKIVSNGTSGSGPTSFTVRTKGGRVLEYGTTADSRIEVAPGQSTVRVWAVSKVSDTVGNYMTVTYSDQAGQTDFQPELISYTMNAAGGVSTPFATVDFVYESRADTPVGGLYQGGWPVTNGAQRLANIRTYNGATLVRDYDLNYDTNGIGSASRLTSVVECPATGSCLPPTTFSWVGTGAAPVINAASIALPSGVTTTNYEPIFGDWNGDGLTDLFLQPKSSGGTAHLYTANASGVQQATSFNPTGWSRTEGTNNPRLVFTGDFNADGLTDLARLTLTYWSTACFPLPDGTSSECGDTYYSTIEVYHASGTGASVTMNLAQTLSLGQTWLPGPSYLKTGDWDGDGRTDIRLSHAVGGMSDFYFTNSSGQLDSPQSIAVPETPSHSGDFDGDGRTDFLFQPLWPGDEVWRPYFWEGNNLVAKPTLTFSGASVPPYTPVIADYNGDGLDDILFRRVTSPFNVVVYLSRGDGNFTQVFTTTGWENVFVGDWNVDGRADIAAKVGTAMQFYRSTGFPTANTLFLPMVTQSGWGDSSLMTADFNGDGVGELWRRTASADSIGTISNGGPDIISSVTNGFGVVTSIGYAPMTASSVYTKGALASHPYVTVQNPRRVVSSLTTHDGTFTGTTPNTRVTNYTYERAIVNLERRASMGFAKMTMTDTRANVKEVSTYDQTFPFVGMPTRVERRISSTNALLQETDYTNVEAPPENGVHFPYVEVEHSKAYELDGVLASRSRRTSYFDDYGNSTRVRVEQFDSASETTPAFETITDSYFGNDMSNWLLGQLVCQKVQSSFPAPAKTRTYGFEYAPTTGLLKKEVVEPQSGNVTLPGTFTGPPLEPELTECKTAAATDTDITLITTYDTHDAFGNPTQITVDDDNVATTSPRVTSVLYGELDGAHALTVSNGRFPVRVINPKNHYVYVQYDARFGTIARAEDPNGRNTYRYYDALGRLQREVRPDGTQTDFYLGWCNAATCALPATSPLKSTGKSNAGKLKMLTVADGAPPSAVVSDSLGRVLINAVTGFDGKATLTIAEHNDKGELLSTSRPYAHGATSIYWNTFTYDARSRVLTETNPGESDNVTTTTAYMSVSGDTGFIAQVETIDEAGRIRREQFNARGDLVRVIEAAASADEVDVVYTYDAFGNLVTTVVAGDADTTITNEYDIRGRRLSMDDPDLAPEAGVKWQYRYYAFGEELRWQSDAKGQVTNFTYDVLGRLENRNEASGAVVTALQYDTATNGIGQLYRSTLTEGSESEEKTFSYDTAGRLSSTSTVIGGVTGSFVTSQAFDTNTGLLSEVTYPGSTIYPTGLRVRYQYNGNGYLTEVRNNNLGAPAYNALYWQQNEQTAEGQLKKATFGNGVTTENTYVPQTGRIDAIRTRLGGSGAWAIQNFEYDFNAIGNLTRRADLNLNVSEQLTDPDSYDALNRVRRVRRYTGATLQEERTVEYDILGNVMSKTQLTGSTTGTYDYSTAATCTGITDQVTPGVHAVRRITADSITGDFCYDANGNQRSSWNFTRNRARTVTYTPYNKPKTVTESTTTVTFAYGADRSRFKRVNSATGRTTLYIDGLFERETTGGSTHTYVHYIVAGGAPVAIYENDNVGSTPKTRYLHRDHLGSVTHLTNESGAVAEPLSYDPWGKRRNATTWANAGSQIFADETPRGYTGHEHLDDVSLVHMNGRAYDPDTGRMLSADPYVQAPGHTQSYNRYSYVFNNPLRYTDPSGYCTVAGASCPTSGFGGFVGGYAAARTGAPPRLSMPVLTIYISRVPVRSMGFGFTGGLIGGGEPGNVFGGGCGNLACSFDDMPGGGGGFNWGMTWDTSWVMFTSIRISAPLYLPNNEQGNTQTIIGKFEQNWGGPSGSLVLDAPGNPSTSSGLPEIIPGSGGHLHRSLGTKVGDYMEGRLLELQENLEYLRYLQELSMQGNREAQEELSRLMLGSIGGGGITKAVAGRFAARGGAAAAKEVGILRDALRGKGNFGLGSGTRAEAERLGRAWVGDGYKVASDGKTLVSADGLRQFRPPSFKPNLGIEQANFERRLISEGQWFGNGHLDVIP